MKVIGITGGVGAGKTKILSYIEQHYNCRVILADEVAARLKKKGNICYTQLVGVLGEKILGADLEIDKNKMATFIFENQELLGQVNAIVHPRVTEYILNEIENEKKKKITDYFFIEAALLIECGYERYVDELWFIYANEHTRKERLRNNRQYSEEKTEKIMMSQMSEEQFLQSCKVRIDNTNSFAETIKQIDRLLQNKRQEEKEQ